MKAIFRVDASTQIGSGHIMRCLTLADSLSKQGTCCEFICRDHAGNMINFIEERGYRVAKLPLNRDLDELSSNTSDEYLSWLGADNIEDAENTIRVIKDAREKPDWMIVDHYAIDHEWEKALRSVCKNIMVIDDLANRVHDCDVLLDQTFGRVSKEYENLTPNKCKRLVGSQYALLRPEFSEMREYSLARRHKPKLKQLLITLGGVDKDNVILEVLESLQQSDLPLDCKIIIVMGFNAPWFLSVKEKTEEMKWHTTLLIAVDNMAKIMSDSDLCIGAAGSTTWERCSLGLPTIMLKLAENQDKVIKELSYNNSIIWLQNPKELRSIFKNNQIERLLYDLSSSSKHITDGAGTKKIVNILSEIKCK